MLRALMILALTLALFAAPAPLRAAPPVPQSKAQALENVESKLEEEKRKQTEAARKLDSLKAQMDDTRGALVSLAAATQDNEKTLSALESDIARAAGEKAQLETDLAKDKGIIAGLILALERMRRAPPESLIARPGAPLDAARSAMLLRGSLPAVNGRAAELSEKMARLRDLTAELERDRAAALQTRNALTAKRQDMQALTSRREKLYAAAQGDLDRHTQTAATLARESRTLQDLLSNLEKDRKAREASAPAARTVARLYGDTPPRPGSARLPAAGRLVEAYGKPNAIGAVSQGLTIETQPGAVVVAPMGGIVRFAGPFKNYGNMVIIEHKGGYHSLIGRLDKITVAQDGRVEAGEPIGQLPLASSRNAPPALYYELRSQGRPVDPAGTFSELKS